MQWIELKFDRNSHLCVKNYCTPSETQILHSKICYPQYLDIDILVILVEPLLDESEYYMLEGLFLHNHCLENWDWRNSNELFDDMNKMLPKHGFKTARTGGSLGLCFNNSDMRSFLYKKSICQDTGQFVGSYLSILFQSVVYCVIISQIKTKNPLVGFTIHPG